MRRLKTAIRIQANNRHPFGEMTNLAADELSILSLILAACVLCGCGTPTQTADPSSGTHSLKSASSNANADSDSKVNAETTATEVEVKTSSGPRVVKSEESGRRAEAPAENRETAPSPKVPQRWTCWKNFEEKCVSAVDEEMVTVSCIDSSGYALSRGCSGRILPRWIPIRPMIVY